MKRETKRFVLYTLTFIIIIASLTIFSFLIFRDIREQNEILLYSVIFIAIYPTIPILVYRRNITHKIQEIRQSFRYCYNCGALLKLNKVKSCTKCGYRFPIDKLIEILK